MNRPLTIVLCVSVLSVSACLSALLLTLQNDAALLPREAVETRAAILTQVHREGEDTRKVVNGQFTALSLSMIREVAAIRLMADAHLTKIEDAGRVEISESRTQLLGLVNRAISVGDSRLGEFNVSAAALQSDLHQSVQPARDLLVDVRDSLDDLYPDLKAGVESGTVAATSTARASMDVQESLPKFLKTWDSIGNNVNGIAQNVNRLTKPKWYDRWIHYAIDALLAYRVVRP